MTKEIVTLLLGIANDLSVVDFRDILDAMGIESVEGVLFVGE